MYWKPHMSEDGRIFPLGHLHPFRFEVTLPQRETMRETRVEIHVGFGLHCFTRKIQTGDCTSEIYRDDREERTFCVKRYQLSSRLRAIVESLPFRRCGFAKHDNYVTIDVVSADGSPIRYGVFFVLRGLRRRGDNTILLVVQSAYELDPVKPLPSRGNVRLNVLLGHALRGTKPKPAR